ncbi:MAG: cytosine permease [Clostridiales Family XIII bacterium]|jgi:NCS1 family nucleobase:cation symporter-1|nr:cytosine permease [Clostridiales Family XIII bacterium]
MVELTVEREAVFGTLPIPKSGRRFGFFDAFLILSGYCIATWSYTQGVYLTTLVGFGQLLIGAFFGALLMLLIYQLPVILSVRFGIDIWVYLKTVFGHGGVRLVAVLIIIINFPWYSVCAELFASSMQNLSAVFGLPLPSWSHLPLAILCATAGTVLALRGVAAIAVATRILVPILIAVGVLVIVIAFRAVPAEAIWSYRPARDGNTDNIIPYIMSIEANFAFVITLVGGMAGIPRLVRAERAGYWAGVLGQGVSGSLFVVAGAVMSIAMQHVAGQATEDPTLMLATLASPAFALASLMLVAFANIGTQAVGSYIYGVMLKASFSSVRYRTLLLILLAYVCGLCAWGGITKYFGAFLTIAACVYAPLAALLFADFFIVRRGRFSLRAAFGLPGHGEYSFTRGFNLVGLFCVAAGVAVSLLIYDPVNSIVHIRPLFMLTPTGATFVITAALYCALCRIPRIRRYLFRGEHGAEDGGK